MAEIKTKTAKIAKKSKSGGGARKLGRNQAKSCQKRYVSEHRLERNILRRAKRHAKRIAYFAKRRAMKG